MNFPFKGQQLVLQVFSKFCQLSCRGVDFFHRQELCTFGRNFHSTEKTKNTKKKHQKTSNDPSQELHVFFNHMFHVFLFFKMLTHIFFKVGIPGELLGHLSGMWTIQVKLTELLGGHLGSIDKEKGTGMSCWYLL